MQTRREFLNTSAALGAGLAAGCATGRAHAAGGRPNVVIIVSDDHGYGDFGCYGNPVLKTPSLDRLHDESVRLARYYVCPVCAPTRAGLMTGRYPYRMGVVDTFLGRALMDPSEVTLAEMLRHDGYTTGLFGKWHLGDSYPLRPMDRGFDESLVLKGGGLVQAADPRVKSYFDPILWHNGVETPTKGYCTDVVTNAAIDFVRARKDKPFFTVITTNAPHTPLDVDDKYVAPYRAQGVPDEDAKFYGMVANLDENVGRFLGELDTLGLRENTLVIFFTDNGAQFTKAGPRFNMGLRGQKGTVYEGGIRVPCFVRWPKAFAGGKDVNDLAAMIDIAPTVLAACGVTAPKEIEFDGVNLLPALRDGKPMPERVICTQWHRGDIPQANKNAAVIGQRYKLVEGRELYDLQNDPGEQKDVAADNTDIVKLFRALYDGWFADVCNTRGFAAVSITIGDPHESTTWLTGQDMREVENWGPADLGAWELNVAQAGNYSFEVDWLPNYPPGAGTCTLQLGDKPLAMPLAEGAVSLSFGPIALEAGRIRLGCALATSAKKLRPEWILARRV